MSIPSKKTYIYLDNAAATPISSKVLEEIKEVGKNLTGNPSSFNDSGRMAKDKLEKSRLLVARFLGAKTEEIIFTSSGSEANNMAVFGLARANIKRGEIITTPVEHPSILEPLDHLRQDGWKITYLNVNKEGVVDVNDLKRKLNPNVVLVSVMYANNEIGTIQPIREISKVISDFKQGNRKRNHHPVFHIDACQATPYLRMDVNELGADLLTFNGSKIYGPRGVGVLYKKRSIELEPLIYGGDQEYGLRAGTENLPAIAGLTRAISLLDKKEGDRARKLRDYFISSVKTAMPEIKLNGPTGSKRLNNNINISVQGLSSENLLLELDKYGIRASSGSACTARSVEPSHVLRAIGLEKKYLQGALRFSLGRQTTIKDVNYVLKTLPKVIKELKNRYIK